MAGRFAYDAKVTNGDGHMVDSQLFSTPSKASKYLRETYKASFAKGSLGFMAAGENDHIEVKGKTADGTKVWINLDRRPLN